MEESNVADAVLRPRKIRTVGVLCGSSAGKRKCYSDAAVELGRELAARKVGLVYGGAGVGLMGIVSHTVYNNGGNVFGIMPRALIQKEINGGKAVELDKAVASLHQMKVEMARHSDAFIALPGGYGMLEQLLEVISWAQLGIHKKPVGLLNVDGYFNSLLAFIDKAIDEAFIKPFQRNILVCASTTKELFQKLEDYVPVHDAVVAKLRWELEVEYNSQQTEMDR